MPVSLLFMSFVHGFLDQMEGLAMKLSWLEDFVTLVDEGTFSRAAVRRNVTQPAFSRRIQMLEDWLGLQLVERGPYHLRLTRTGAGFEAQIRALVERIYELRGEMRADASASSRLSLTTQHTLMITHLPSLLRHLQDRQRGTGIRIRAGNLEECVDRLGRGEVDLLLCFEQPGEPSPIGLGGTRRLRVGHEQLLPVCVPELYPSPFPAPDEAHPLKLLSYPKESFIGKVVHDRCLSKLIRQHAIEIVCESAFTAGIKEMSLAGMGVAWLPLSLVRGELASGALTILDQTLDTLALDVAVYCRQENSKPVLLAIWELLETEPLDLGADSPRVLK
jgi:DNA-binding transcriptional LysR family regulator